MTSQSLFNIAQTFLIDTSIASAKDLLHLTSVELFFKHKPVSNNNQSGVSAPGITLYLTDTIYNVPRITQDTYMQAARVEYAQILTSSDATVPTKFSFNQPVLVSPGKLYAFVLSYDGNEQFFPWTAKKGSWIATTRNVFSGPSGNFTGNYYEFITPTDLSNNPSSATSQQDYLSYWSSLLDTNLTFKVNCARFFIKGTPVSYSNTILTTTPVTHGIPTQTWDGSTNGQLSFIFPSYHNEGISFDISSSTVQAFVGAQRAYQNTVFWPGGYSNGNQFATLLTNGSVIVTANSTFPNGAAFNWNSIYGNYTGTKFLTLFDTSLTNVRKVVSILSNTVIQVDEPITFSNTASKFMIAPVATVDSIFPSSPQGFKDHFLWLSQSAANSTVRFVNNCIEAITISNGGIGYSNSDILYIKGFQSVAGKVTGGYVAVANIQTNGNGVITNTFLANIGCGFVNSSAIVAIIANSTNVGNTTSNTTGGANAAFSYTVGATLKTELTNNIFKNCIVGNFGYNDITPFFTLTVPVGTSYNMTMKSPYYSTPDNSVFGGTAFFVSASPQSVDLQLGHSTRLISNQVPSFVSFSNEFEVFYSNGALNDQVSALTFTSNSFILSVNTASNNDYVCVSIDSPPTVDFGRYIINSDYTGEETNSGNAFAKHLTTHINFARFAEDLIVHLTAYKPANTDIQVYARIQNSTDPEPFDDEDYTRLQLISGINILSSLNSANDYIELAYGFQPVPNTSITLTGTITTTNASSTLTGTNTAFTSNLAISNLVKLYDPLFPNTNFLVASVNSIANDTSLTLDKIISSNVNVDLVNTGLKLDLVVFPHQAFNNIQNENVVRYYNSSTVKYDNYDNLQLKIVLLSSSQQNIPRIHNIRASGVSA